MTILQILVLAIVQGMAELLPVSSSAHVIVAEKLMRLDPSRPEMTFLLVMLHTGTMCAVIVYFWKAWRRTFFASLPVFKVQAKRLIIATALTGIVGVPLIFGIPRLAGKLGFISRDDTGQFKSVEVEDLFGNLQLISSALAAAGLLILYSGLSKRSTGNQEIGSRQSVWIGAVQGLCLPFRGFSRSGATISTALLWGAVKPRAEEFSFALAVIITPAAIAMEGRRLLKHNAGGPSLDLGPLLLPSLAGLVFSFLAGLVALKLLSRILERGRWYLFGAYCLAAAAAVFALHLYGY